MWLRRIFKDNDYLINLDEVIKITKEGSVVIRFFFKKNEHEAFVFENRNDRDNYYLLLLQKINHIID
jgi:hypothetical protein